MQHTVFSCDLPPDLVSLALRSRLKAAFAPWSLQLVSYLSARRWIYPADHGGAGLKELIRLGR